ncbi:hypothetical protein Lal_00044001 [Lupinus albus]|nr:hypothetical protein Lal_00044001 [Lupinus albus]
MQQLNLLQTENFKIDDAPPVTDIKHYRRRFHLNSYAHREKERERERERESTVNFGSRMLYTSASSIIKSYKFEKALSNTIPAIEGSSAP